MSCKRCRDLTMSGLENINSSHGKHSSIIAVLFLVPPWRSYWMEVKPLQVHH